MTDAIDPIARISGQAQQGVDLSDRQEEPQREVRERLKPIAHIELLAPLHQVLVATVENVEQDDGDPDIPCGPSYALERIGEEKASKSPALEPGIDADHRYERGGYLAMTRSVAHVAGGQMGEIHAVRVQGVESHKHLVWRQKDKGPYIVRPIEFARCLAQIIVDLGDTGHEGCPLVPRGIKRLDDHRFVAHAKSLLPVFDHLVMPRKSLAQRFGGRARIIQRIEDRVIILAAHNRPLVRLDRLQRRLVGGIHHEGGIIEAAPCRRPLNGLFDVRLCAKIHAYRAALIDRTCRVVKRLHRLSLFVGIRDLMYAFQAHISRLTYVTQAPQLKQASFLGILVLSAMVATPAHASKCEAGTIFNPITKVRWTCIFPITIGGVKVGSFDSLSKELDAQSASKPLCACRKGVSFWFGVKVSFWSPNRLVDVVTEPGCMMALGADLMPTGGKLQGSQSGIADGTNSQKMFAQMHYYIAPVWKMLDMFTDLPCIEDDGFDVALITEVLPTWQSGTLGAIIQPEGILFGNPAAGLACMADSAAAAAGKVIDPLFWCMGSWGSTYPIAGDIHFGDSVEAWAGLAARGTFMMGRLGALTTSSADGCSFKAQPIWTKSRYKLQIMEPVKGGKCVNIGRPGALWSSAKHAPGKDNAQFMLFEKVICCAGIGAP
ncbi:Protein TraU [Sphingobium sp. EP60837]|nr:Protein TraU [Sphingobium sp. EP60837]